MGFQVIQVFWTLPSYVENPNLEFFHHYHCGAFLGAYLYAWQVFEYYILRSKSLHWIGMVIIIHFLFPPYHSLLQVFYCWLISWMFPWVPRLCWRRFQTWPFLIPRLREDWATSLLSLSVCSFLRRLHIKEGTEWSEWCIITKSNQIRASEEQKRLMDLLLRTHDKPGDLQFPFKGEKSRLEDCVALW